MDPKKIELIHFGNELLIGEISNTNASWLAKTLTNLGFRIQRITTLDDNIETLEMGFTEALQRNPFMIISTGGLGPTWDDSTLLGLSNALNEPLFLNNEALKMIQNQYTELGIKSKPAIKMAKLPRNSTPLQNKIGTAPGVYYLAKKTHLFVLPGVPQEMKAMVGEHVISHLELHNFSNYSFFQSKFMVTGLRESLIADITEKMTKNYPEIYIKSHPKGKNLTFHLTAYGNPLTNKKLKEVEFELQKFLMEIGGHILEFNNKKNYEK